VLSVYVLVAIIKKQLSLYLNLYTIRQIFSVILFEQVSFLQILTEADSKPTMLLLVTDGCYLTYNRTVVPCNLSAISLEVSLDR